MGQQQLLLLVLGIVIVGLAVVAGINAFSENQEKSQKDAILNEGMRLATDVQAQALKPEQMGGTANGALPGDLTEAGFAEAGSESDPYTTPWGQIVYNSTDGTLTLDPTSSDDTAIITVNTNGDSPELTQNWTGGGGTTPTTS